jgi:hypothetical protein
MNAFVRVTQRHFQMVLPPIPSTTPMNSLGLSASLDQLVEEVEATDEAYLAGRRGEEIGTICVSPCSRYVIVASKFPLPLRNNTDGYVIILIYSCV